MQAPCRHSRAAPFAYSSVCSEHRLSVCRFESLPERWPNPGEAGGAALARLLKQPCSVVQVDERSAREIGEFIAAVRLARGGKPDVADAQVALVTRSTNSLVWTSDPDDMASYGVTPEFVRQL